MNTLRLLLFVVIGIILWRLFSMVLRIMQGGGRKAKGDGSTFGKRKPDLHEIQDAEFEDLTGKEPPKNPPPEQ